MKTKTFITLIALIILLNNQFVFSQNWQQIGPKGGFFKEFVFHPTNSNIVYAGSDDGGGVWKTTDGGNNWTLLTSAFPNMTGWSITIDENNPDTIYASDAYGRYGILKSTDGGNNWSQSTTGLSTAIDRIVSGLVIMSNDTLLISTGMDQGNGIFRSTNGGNTWSPSGMQGMSFTCINKNIFGTVFAGSDRLYYSTNKGASWTFHPDIPLSVIYAIDVRDSVIAIGSSTGVYLSTNRGTNFSNIGLSGEFNFDIAIHSLAPNIKIYCSTIPGLQLYSSVTSTWSMVAPPELNNQLVIGIASNGTDVYCAAFSNSPIIKSNDGGSNWAYLSNSPVATEISGIYIDPTNNSRIITCLLGTYGADGNKESIYETNDGGLTWIRKGPVAHALSLKANPQNPTTLYLGTFMQGLFKTTNSFITFTNIISGGDKWIGDIAVSNTDTNVVLVVEYDFSTFTPSLKRSTDGGATFSNTASFETNDILFHPINNDTVYASTVNGIYRSTDMGITWNYWMLSGQNMFALEFHNGNLFASNNQGLLYKISGSSYLNVSGSWQTPTEIKNIYSVNNTLFVGLNAAETDTTYIRHGSLWSSNDDGNTWSNITANMTSTNIYGGGVIAKTGSELLVGTYGGGVFKSSGLALSVTETAKSMEINLYPNPSNGIFYLENVNGAIEIYNVLGERIFKTPNIQHKTFNEINLSDHPKGIYFVKIYDGEKIYTNKIIVQ